MRACISQTGNGSQETKCTLNKSSGVSLWFYFIKGEERVTALSRTLHSDVLSGVLTLF